jgi:hypothetical protein
VVFWKGRAKGKGGKQGKDVKRKGKKKRLGGA